MCNISIIGQITFWIFALYVLKNSAIILNNHYDISFRQCQFRSLHVLVGILFAIFECGQPMKLHYHFSYCRKLCQGSIT